MSNGGNQRIFFGAELPSKFDNVLRRHRKDVPYSSHRGAPALDDGAASEPLLTFDDEQSHVTTLSYFQP